MFLNLEHALKIYGSVVDFFISELKLIGFFFDTKLTK
jgi:hypothetical protein